MKTIDISDANEPLSKYARELNGDSVILTKNSKPIAALVPLGSKDTGSMKTPDPTFVRIIEEARESFRKHGGISGDELQRQLDLPAAKKVRPPHRTATRKRSPR